MARTDKDEHATDGMHTTFRLERQSRQPQRDRVAFEADLALDSDAPTRLPKYRTHPARNTERWLVAR